MKSRMQKYFKLVDLKILLEHILTFRGRNTFEDLVQDQVCDRTRTMCLVLHQASYAQAHQATTIRHNILLKELMKVSWRKGKNKVLATMQILTNHFPGSESLKEATQKIWQHPHEPS